MNKYFYLLATGLLLFCTCRAQIGKGELLLGGTVSFQKQDNNPITPNYPSSTVTTVAPSFGKAIRGNLLAGVNLSYGYSKMQTGDGVDPEYTLKEYEYGLTFFIRRYKDLGHNFSLFVEGDFGGSYSRQKGAFEGAGELNTDIKGYAITASLAAGVAYRITHRWVLETGFPNMVYMDYGHSRYGGSSYPEGLKSNGFYLVTNLNRALNYFAIGGRYVLN
ncbi:MAG TPA: hypothetical protein VHC96_13045 [Puia sp.]|nr:hypothetical protein [Puia sp.]